MPRLSSEERTLAQQITARRVVEAVRDPFGNESQKTRALGDFLLCSLSGLKNEELRRAAPHQEFSLTQAGHYPTYDLRGHVVDTLVGLDMPEEGAVLVGGLTEDRSRMYSIFGLSYIPRDEAVEGIHRGPRDSSFVMKEFIRGIIASEQIPIS